MPKLAVLGQPVAHSRSPAMQNAALAELGLAPEWSYGAIEVAPRDFAELVGELAGTDDYLGVNVTVPHKLAALASAHEASAVARAIGAANTLTFADGRIAAENTDGVGIIDSLPSSPAGKRALVLGAGGSARAAIWALKHAGAEVYVWNRTEASARALADEFGVELAAGGSQHADASASRELRAASFELLVNATTVGLASASEGQPSAESGFPDLKDLPIDADAIKAEVVLDLVYGSHETQLIAAARAAGAIPVDGLDVLVYQGAASLRLWTGAEPPIEIMRAAARGEVFE
jgi:shikimate dehydrogenase